MAARVAAALDRLAPPGALGVALSGGSDSTALLLAARDWAEARGRALEAATVDHRLRAGSAAEAASCARLCAGLGVTHATLVWEAAPGRGNLQAAARQARLGLLGHWARQRRLGAVLLGHTRDDQAETVLLRLARGSGVDGLSAMAEAREARGVAWLRPLLGLGRAALRGWLGERGQGWIDDPSNDDPRFERVKARAVLAALAPLGLGAEGLAATAARLGAERRVLERLTADLAERARRVDATGAVHLEVAALAAAEPEIARRLLADTLHRLSGAAHPPRRKALERLWRAVLAPDFGGATLAGCTIRRREGRLTLQREPAAVAAPLPAVDGALWDGRWRLALHGPWPPAVLGALGSRGLGVLRAAGHWRDVAALPARVTPALFADTPDGASEGALLAAPLAGYRDGVLARTGCLSHMMDEAFDRVARPFAMASMEDP